MGGFFSISLCWIILKLKTSQVKTSLIDKFRNKKTDYTLKKDFTDYTIKLRSM